MSQSHATSTTPAAEVVEAALADEVDLAVATPLSIVDETGRAPRYREQRWWLRT